MHEGKIGVFVSFLLFITTQGNPTSVVYNDMEYLLYRFDDEIGRLSYYDANALCVNEGGKLALIKNANVQIIIQQQLELWKNEPNEGWVHDWLRGYWIGGFCGNNCGVVKSSATQDEALNKPNWKWSDGSRMYDGYTNWYSNLEPNNPSNVATYVYNFNDIEEYINTFGTWGDDIVTNTKNYICQRETACYSNPCDNGGTCEIFRNQYICHCMPGYDGTNCKISKLFSIIFN
uniref:fibropellin-1-like n=1 Tax=Ciona intestinalis TaxID=7719 RepID=UPI000EF4E398|nr:fibropellin-1-like [Ciona intestinalis]|eukprot:XP_026695559.1 fibropellin-1-like [Ciona intestinalis]